MQYLPRMTSPMGGYANPISVSVTSTAQSIPVSRIDRWSIYRRLQELMIPCWCLNDGSLWVEINNSTTAVLVRSVIQHCIAPRRELVSWLEHCWDAAE